MATALEIEIRDKADKKLFRWMAKHDTADPVNGIARCRDVIRGHIAALATALAAIDNDTNAVRQFIAEVLPPPQHSRPYLVIDNQPAA